MPQIAPRGKFIFGWSIIGDEGQIFIPEQTRAEYDLQPGQKVILMALSRTSGAFSVGSWARFERSKLEFILDSLPQVANGLIPEGETLPYKGCRYGWGQLHPEGYLRLAPMVLAALDLRPGDPLLSIRGSDIAFDFAVKGPLVEAAQGHPEIPCFR